MVECSRNVQYHLNADKMKEGELEEWLPCFKMNFIKRRECLMLLLLSFQFQSN